MSISRIVSILIVCKRSSEAGLRQRGRIRRRRMPSLLWHARANVQNLLCAGRAAGLGPFKDTANALPHPESRERHLHRRTLDHC